MTGRDTKIREDLRAKGDGGRLSFGFGAFGAVMCR
jgi:hypothetical protein